MATINAVFQRLPFLVAEKPAAAACLESPLLPSAMPAPPTVAITTPTAPPWPQAFAPTVSGTGYLFTSPRHLLLPHPQVIPPVIWAALPPTITTTAPHRTPVATGVELSRVLTSSGAAVDGVRASVEHLLRAVEGWGWMGGQPTPAADPTLHLWHSPATSPLHRWPQASQTPDKNLFPRVTWVGTWLLWASVTPPPPPAHLPPPVPCAVTAVGLAMLAVPMAVTPVPAIQFFRGALLKRPSHSAPPWRHSAAAAAEHIALQHGSQSCQTPLPWILR